MKTFNKLPSDPTVQALTDEQVDFIILSMNRDAEEQQAAMKGTTLADYVDNDEDYENDIFYRNDTDWELVRPGQDPEKIYEQVQAMTAAKDPEYEAKAKDKLANARDNLLLKVTSKNEKVDTYINQQIAEVKKRLAENENQTASNNSNQVDLSDLEHNSEFTDLWK